MVSEVRPYSDAFQHNLPKSYIRYLKSFSRILGSQLYLYGGWTLAAAFEKYYFGDVDVVSDDTLTKLQDILNSRNIPYSRTTRGSLRVPMGDGNFIDLNSLKKNGESGDIESFLSSLTFSIHSLALDLNNDKWILTDAFRKSFKQNSFQLNSDVELPVPRPLSVARTKNVLEQAYGLKFAGKADYRWKSVEEAQRRWPNSVTCSSSAETLKHIKAAVSDYLPPNTRNYLCKGALRSSLLQQFTAWDDIDIMVELSRTQLLEFCSDKNFSFELNHFGNPKLFLPVGQTVDLIPAPNDESILSHLTHFFHPCDAICWDVDNEEIYDPLRNFANLTEGIIDLKDNVHAEYDANELAFYSLKSVYLALRHNFDYSLRFGNFINSPHVFTPHHKRICMKLIDDLISNHGIEKTLKSLCLIDDEVPSSAVDLFKHFLHGRMDPVENEKLSLRIKLQ